MRIGAGVCGATLLLLTPDTSQPKPISRHPHPVDAFPRLRILSLRKPWHKAPRFARHLIDNRRHEPDLATRETQLYSWYIRQNMRNPDHWQPPERTPKPP